MNSFIRKSALIGLLSAFSLATLFAAPVGVYAKVDHPQISISERNSNSIVLKVKQTDLDNKKVTIRVRLEKISSGEKFDRTFKVRLNNDGQKKITIKDLLGETQYKVKAKIKNRNGDTYSDFSRTIKFSTR
jgi:hypothetical protein